MSIPKDTAAKVTATLRSKRHRAMVSGEGLRDEALGVKTTEFEVTTSATPDDIHKIFATVSQYDKATRSCTVIVGEIPIKVRTIFKKWETDESGAPRVRQWSSALKEDCEQRDFTCNGLFWDPDSGKLWNYLDGTEHIKDKILKVSGDIEQKIAKDPMIMLKAVSMSICLGFHMEFSLQQGIKASAERFRQQKGNAIRTELMRCLTVNPCHTLNVLAACGLLKHVIPEVYNLIGMGKSENGVDPYVHTLSVLNHLYKMEAPPLLIVAGLLHDTGRIAMKPEHHAEESAEIAGRFCKRLGFTSEEKTTVRALVYNHEIANYPTKYKSTELELCRWMRHMEEQGILGSLIMLQHCDAMANGTESQMGFFNKKIEEFGERISPKPLIDGYTLINELGFTSSPLIGVILSEIRDGQDSGEIKNKEEALAYIQEHFDDSRNKSNPLPADTVPDTGASGLEN